MWAIEERSEEATWFLTDLIAVVVLVLVTNVAVFHPLVRETPLRVVVGIPFLLFLPGYALMAALFPESNGVRTNGQIEKRFAVLDPGPSIDMIERVVLSFGTSLIIVPLVGFLLNFTPYEIRMAPVVTVVSGVVIALVSIGALRRYVLPPTVRFRVPVRSWLVPLWTDAARHRANVLIVVGLVVALSGLGYALTASTDEPVTEFYLVTETDDGEYVTSGYPRHFTVGESKSTTTVITNRGASPTTYTLVVLLQRVRIDGNEVTVVEEVEESRVTLRVGTNEARYQQIPVTPSIQGNDLRLTYLLYTGEPSADPSTETAMHALFLWIDVAESEDTSSVRRA